MDTRQGYIYKITNDVNDMAYVGQTIRDVDLRFNEHCFDKRSTSKIHRAIVDIGYQHFSVETLERVAIEKLDEREKYWISFFDTYNNGYNSTIGGQYMRESGVIKYYKQIACVERNIIFNSIEDAARIIHEITKWDQKMLKTHFKSASENGEEFLGYHWVSDFIPDKEITSIDDVEDWAKTISIKFAGKHVHCIELNVDAATHTEMAVYLIKNGYYTGNTKTPIQTLITGIAKSIKKGWQLKTCEPPLSFEDLPGTTKQPGGIGCVKKDVYCPEIDKKFDSVVEASKYFLDNNIFQKIKLKTVKSRISDVLNGYFEDYKGYHFISEQSHNERNLQVLEKYKLNYTNSQKEIKKTYCCDCGAEIYYTSIRCLKCVKIHQRKVIRPKRNELKQLVRNNSILSVARKYNVTGATIVKWCKFDNIPSKKSEINSYTDKEWEKI